MEAIARQADGNAEDLTVRKKSRFTVLKSRIFNRLKKKETEGRMKPSQSTGDVTAQEGGRSEEESEDDSLYLKGTLSSRALSHDSIFLADQVQSSEPSRVLSQEKVHSKIKALQLKLQQQNMRLVRPPIMIPGKHMEDSGMASEDDGLPCSPPEMSFQEAPNKANTKFVQDKQHLSWLSLAGTGSEEEELGGFSQPSSRPLSPASPFSQLVLTSSPADLTTAFDGVDFTSPAQLPILDNSAARHRMSIKPRNQRTSTKRKTTPNLHPKSNSMNNLDQPLSEREETTQAVTATQTLGDSSQTLGDTSQTLGDTSQTLGDTSQTLGDYSCYCQDVTQAEVSLMSTLKLQGQETVRLLNGGPLSSSSKQPDKAIKPAEPLQPEDRIKGNTPVLQTTPTMCSLVLCNDLPTVRTSDPTEDHLAKEPSNESQNTVTAKELFQNSVVSVQVPDPPENKTTRHDVINESKENNVTLGKTDANTVSTEVFKSPEPLTRITPVPLIHNQKPASAHKYKSTHFKRAHLKASNEKQAGLFTVIDGSLRQDDKPDRSGSFSLCSASAKHLSKTSGEQKAKKEEVYDNILPRSPSCSLNLVAPVKPETNTKSTNAAVSNPVQKISSQNDTLAQNASKTAGGNNPQTKEDRTQEEAENRNGLFGVKLRSTSLSLKYRSDIASIKDQTKRCSLEVQALQSGQFRDGTSVSSLEVTRTQEKSALQRSNSHEDSTLNQVSETETSAKLFPNSKSERDCRSEPQWMGITREKTKVNQSFNKLPAQPVLPPNVSSASTTLSSSTQKLLKPTIQPRLLLLTTSKSQLKTSLTTEPPPASQPSLQHPPKPASRLMLERWRATSQRTEKSAGIQSTNADELVDVKDVTKLRARSISQTEKEPQSQPDRTQPSWMELAKRKSLAWSDKSLE